MTAPELTSASSLHPPVLGLIGCGRMGRALLTGWRQCALPFDVVVVDPARDGAVSDPIFDGCRLFADPADLQNAGVRLDCLVLAIKPQLFDTLCHSVARVLKPTTLIVSIMAGVTLDRLAALIPDGNGRIVRTMPNLPASIGAGATVGIANSACDAADRARVQRLLETSGSFYWMNDESLMDSVTALSGSGPAYVFALGEAMASAAIAQGLPDDLARALARDTLMGAGALIGASPDLSLTALREQVTSTGGTTEAALKVLMPRDAETCGGLDALVDSAMKAARDRGRALAGR